MGINQILQGFIVLTLTAGCASTGKFPGAALENQSGGTVQGVGGTLGSFVATTSPVTGGVAKEILIHRVNGERVNGWGSTNSVRLLPGEYLLDISCSTNAYGQLIMGTEQITIKIEPGHTYQLDALAPCHVSVADAIQDGK